MDTQTQMQAIVDRLAGIPSDNLPPALALDEPWRTIYHRIPRAADRTDAEYLIWKATEHLGDRDDRRQWTRRLVDLLPGDDQFTPFPSLHEISASMHDVDWLWPSWIPRGMVTLLGAAPGVGKSLVALDLARRIIHDEPFPDGAPVSCPGCNVLIVDAEGAPALLNQRARAWDIDRRRLFLMHAPDAGGLINLDHPDQKLQLIEMCGVIRPSLIVVDSLAAATARGETSLQGARNTLGFLSLLARKLNTALLVIHHLRKRAGSGLAASPRRVAADDLRGSGQISAAARSILALSPVTAASGSALVAPLSPTEDPSGPASDTPAPAGHIAGGPQPPASGLLRLEVVKTNLCRHPPPLGLILEGENVPVPVLRYTELVEPPPQPTHLDLCARWLYQFLSDAGEPVKPAAVVRAAAAAGFPRRTLYRARQALAGWVVDLGNSPHDPRKHWVLAEPSPPPIPGGPKQAGA